MDYQSNNLEILRGLDPVKKRPGMYTDTSNPNHLVQEVLDNSIDEAINGYGNVIHVTLNADNSIEVKDKGRGMPVDIHPEEGISGVEVILTQLHAGGKFNDSNYEFAGGLHGVGVTVVNALSSKVEVTVNRNSKVYYICFIEGVAQEPLKEVGTCARSNTGTSVKFWPDKKYFDTTKFDIKSLKHLFEAKSILAPGVTIKFTDKLNNTDDVWLYENGMQEFLTEKLGSEFAPDPVFYTNYKGQSEQIEVCFAWKFEESHTVNESFANLIPTISGGTHVNGLRTGLLEACREFCKQHNLLDKKITLVADDVWSNFNYILSVKLKEAQFQGQTKEKLTSRSISNVTNLAIKDSFLLWLNQNPNVGKDLVARFIENARSRLSKESKIVRKKVTSGPRLPGKLTDCVSTDVTRTELFIVEGNSAGGSARMARNKEFQAILPLRGKILNTWESSSDEVLKNAEVHDIAVAIGLDPNSPDLSGLRYGKICILADADSDGLHIATLLCALFTKHFPALIDNGHVYVAQPPLYRIDAAGKIYYILDESEKAATLKKLANKKVKITRFKGLGEMNPDQLRETTLDPNNRRLLRLKWNSNNNFNRDPDERDRKETTEMMDMLLKKNRSGDRKDWLEVKGDTAMINE